MAIADLLDRAETDGSNSRGISGDFSPEEGTPLTPDPVPGKRRNNAGKAPVTKATAAKARAAGSPDRADMIAEVSEEIQMYAGLAATAWAMRDPVCAPVLNVQARAIADATAVLIARSERLLDLAHGGGLLADIVRLLTALQPVVSVVRAHHITRTIEQEDGGGDALAGYPAFSPSRA